MENGRWKFENGGNNKSDAVAALKHEWIANSR
jgi:hypothetical protein